MMLLRNGQTTFQNITTFLFIIVGLIVIAIFASVTTPFLTVMATANNISGGMGLIVKYWNLLLVVVLLFIGIILVFSGGRQ